MQLTPPECRKGVFGALKLLLGMVWRADCGGCRQEAGAVGRRAIGGPECSSDPPNDPKKCFRRPKITFGYGLALPATSK